VKIQQQLDIIDHLSKRNKEQEQKIAELEEQLAVKEQKIVQLELSKLDEASKPTKNLVTLEEINDMKLVAKWILLEPAVKGCFVSLWENGDTLITKKFLPPGKLKGELFFDKPSKINNYLFKLVNSKQEVLSVSSTFLVAPSITLCAKVNGQKVFCVWENKDRRESGYDWIGLFPNEEIANYKTAYITYCYANISGRFVNFDTPKKGTYKFCYFSAENNSLPIASCTFEIS